MTQTKQAWNLHLIKAAIGMAGLTQTQIAIDAGLEPSVVRHGLRGNNRKGAEAIAKAIGVPFRELFPDSYLRGGSSKPTRKRAESTSQKQHVRVDPKMGAA
jgi:Ner family transcriptional regulator